MREIEKIEIRSKLYEECYRDNDGKLSLFKSGRRFVYVSTHSKPLPEQFVVWKWNPTLYHYGQKEKQSTILSEGEQDQNNVPDVQAQGVSSDIVVPRHENKGENKTTYDRFIHDPNHTSPILQRLKIVIVAWRLLASPV